MINWDVSSRHNKVQLLYSVSFSSSRPHLNSLYIIISVYWAANDTRGARAPRRRDREAGLGLRVVGAWVTTQSVPTTHAGRRQPRRSASWLWLCVCGPKIQPRQLYKHFRRNACPPPLAPPNLPLPTPSPHTHTRHFSVDWPPPSKILHLSFKFISMNEWV